MGIKCWLEALNQSSALACIHMYIRHVCHHVHACMQDGTYDQFSSLCATIYVLMFFTITFVASADCHHMGQLLIFQSIPVSLKQEIYLPQPTATIPEEFWKDWCSRYLQQCMTDSHDGLNKSTLL